MEVKDQEEFRKFIEVNGGNMDHPEETYVAGLVVRWSDNMEARMREGMTVDVAAEATWKQTFSKGISSPSYDFIGSALVKLWKHGEEFRLWWNNKYASSPESAEKANREGGLINVSMFAVELAD